MLHVLHILCLYEFFCVHNVFALNINEPVQRKGSPYFWGNAVGFIVYYNVCMVDFNWNLKIQQYNRTISEELDVRKCVRTFFLPNRKYCAHLWSFSIANKQIKIKIKLQIPIEYLLFIIWIHYLMKNYEMNDHQADKIKSKILWSYIKYRIKIKLFSYSWILDFI